MDIAFILGSDGKITATKPKNGTDFSLEELQAIVGGYIEIVTLDEEHLMVVNEEGKLQGLPLNINASAIYLAKTHIKDSIVGDVLVCNSNMIN